MADVFISYSRLDRDFVGKLREALADHGHDVWIDWESIPESRAWWEEIKKGIARANNFAVILSPNSMASPICQMEIEYAIQLNKRIIPVYYDDFDREKALIGITKRLADADQTVTREIWENRQSHELFDTNDATLKRINYFFFKATDDFPSRFNDLLGVINTDYEHKERHTTLELRAQEWLRRNKDSGFLLIDNELTEAQAWLESAEDKDPAPTDLHREYIATSEQRTQRLRTIRWTAGIGSFVAVIAILIGLFASLQAFNAQNQVFIAGETLTPIPATLDALATVQDESYRFQMAGQAQFLQDNENDALAFAFESVSVEQPPVDVIRQFYKITQESLDESVYFSSAYNGRTIFPFMTYNSVVFSPDGRTLVAGAGNGTIHLWDISMYPQSEHLTILTVPHSSVNSVAFSPDGKVLASGNSNSTITLWDISTGELSMTLAGHTRGVRSISFSPDGQMIASAGDGATIIFWDMVTALEIARIPAHSDRITTITFSPDGQTIASGSRDTSVKLWDASTGQLLQTFTGHDGAILTLAFNSNGQMLVSGSRDESIKLWDVVAGELITMLPVDATVRSVAFSSDGYALVSAGDRFIKLWDTSNIQITNEPVLIANLTTFIDIRSGALTLNGSLFAFGGHGGDIMLGDFVDLPRALRSVQEKLTLREFTCDERERFNMSVPCDADGNFPTRTPYPTPSLIPLLTLDFTPFYENPTALAQVDATNTAWVATSTMDSQSTYTARTATAEASD